MPEAIGGRGTDGASAAHRCRAPRHRPPMLRPGDAAQHRGAADSPGIRALRRRVYDLKRFNTSGRRSRPPPPNRRTGSRPEVRRPPGQEHQAAALACALTVSLP
ncbi:hypothetical protein GCM10023113_10730 [Cellulomonas oligotrophica]|uniref:Uncharacterized protein n=1 Tax=Cellulomonas oligotrophica TaxID=931536 RepID=A0ABQ4D6U9_9CELL|nr:hypothetical protein Col01nite_03470 [Cellulomonas oligotrophica]